MLPVATLRAEPFNLDWGTSVYATIQATNVKGDSEVSEPGNGGVIITYPDAPYNLVEDMSTKSPTSIGLQWTEGTSNGGSTIIRYKVSYAINGGSYMALANSDTTSLTAFALTSGYTY